MARTPFTIANLVVEARRIAVEIDQRVQNATGKRV
jgi:hypothetical protein